VSFIDWDTKEIPDSLLIIGAVAGVMWVVSGHFLPEIFPLAPAWNNALFGIFAGALPLLIIDRITLLVYKKDGFGYGDVKLMAVAGIFLGWQLTLLALLFAVMASFPFAIYFLVKQKLYYAREESSSSRATGGCCERETSCDKQKKFPIRSISQNENFDGYMAFGPFLCIGAVAALWFGENVMRVFILIV
jgi:prepilin signal peptidase PulO-like enzyme (type II secretory pathway)